MPKVTNRSQRKRMERKSTKSKTIIDTNVIIQGIGHRRNPQFKSVRIARVRGEHVYTEQVDREIRDNEGSNPRTIRRLERFRRNNADRMTRVDHATGADLAKYPAKGKDRIIMDEAVKTDTRTIVTQDGTFRKRVNAPDSRRKYRIVAMTPKEYVKSRKRRKTK